jgi:glycosyltransferase involved in cell wall biosynthesis
MNIVPLAEKTSKVLAGLCEDYEVTIVNDGSKDNTAEVSAELAKRDSHVKVINHPKNMGYGEAVKTGMNNAKFEWVFFTDGDSQFDVSEIKELTALTGKYDLINGYRIKRADPFNRKLNAFMWGTMVKMLFGFKVKDVDCAFKLIKKEIIVKAQIESQGALVCTELLAKAAKMGYKIGEVGVHHYPRKAGTQTGAKLKVIIKAFVELFKLYGKIKKWGKS